MLNGAQKDASQIYLAEILRQNPSEDYLEAIWRATQPDYHFSKGSFRGLFEEMLAACKRNRS
jgi:hypothetical protein